MFEDFVMCEEIGMCEANCTFFQMPVFALFQVACCFSLCVLYIIK